MKQTDGRAITNPENAQSFTHAEIKQAADEMNPDGLDSAFDAWSKIATAVTTAGQQFETAIKTAIEQHWEGAAADNAVRGIRDYATRVAEFGETLNAQSTPLSQAASAAAKFKLAVPDVVDTSTNPRGPELRNTNEEQARDEMTSQYIQPYGTTAPAIPTLPPPINPISVPSPGGDSSTDTGTGAVPGTSAANNGSGTGDSSTPAAADKSADTGEAAGTGDAAETGTPEAVPEETAPQSVSPDQNNGASTIPASTTTAATTPQSPTTATPTIAGSPITTALPTPASTPATVASAALNGSPSRSATPSPGPSTSGSPRSEAQPGTSRPAPAPGTAPGAASAQPAATPVRTGAPGMAGYPGMFAPGIRGRGEDDDEHKTPGYLRTEEHAKELLGEVERTVPPVIGEK
ncbi:PPE domain-containing protein [Nocardia iowensis]|uniref:PPE domain-containing protein n=1 Tax=Nocardia iowensis TaxID=204891 RepID=A0ABX8RNZ4_NOCIO|nr:hypothetical protein [Nocardia iowensis]QXN90617.1 hypothetical protein KV110_35385 [Nocardia iowensis]